MFVCTRLWSPPDPSGVEFKSFEVYWNCERTEKGISKATNIDVNENHDLSIIDTSFEMFLTV